ncbi:MAG: ATP-binding protein [Chloroflexota bacterium]
MALTEVPRAFGSATDGCDDAKAIIAWLDNVLAAAVAALPGSDGVVDDQLRGLVVTPGHAAALVSGRRHLAPRGVRPLQAGPRLVDLASRFQLTRAEIHTLAFALGPDLDTRYEQIFGYLQDDVTRRRPTVALAAALFGHNAGVGDEAAVLRASRLLKLVADPQHTAPPELAHYLVPDSLVLRHLTGNTALDPRLEGIATMRGPSTAITPMPASAAICRLAATWQPLRLRLDGPTDAGQHDVVANLAAQLDRLVIELELPAVTESTLSTILWTAVTEARLRDALLHLSPSPRLNPDRHADFAGEIGIALDRHPLPIILSHWPPAIQFGSLNAISVPLPAPSFGQRRQYWTEALARTLPAGLPAAPDLASRFRLGPRAIQAAVSGTQRDLVWQDATAGTTPTTGAVRKALFVAARQASSARLGEVAQRVAPRATWDSLVVPPDQRAQLRDLASAYKRRHVVLADWGFDAALSNGKGFNALFAGPSGTGKTLAAEVIAADLGLDLYRIDLSQVVSKYIGETEKNLDRIFREAEDASGILFFDEADALFGKRSDVRDAHDRYANIEVGYLLQKIEQYEGMALLATNLRANLDEAFARRMQYTIEFPFPDEQHRLLIWQRVFPAQAPLHEDVDLPLMARTYRFSGGNIRNVALAAAFLAADDGGSIRMSHVQRAARRELLKIGHGWDGGGR